MLFIFFKKEIPQNMIFFPSNAVEFAFSYSVLWVSENIVYVTKLLDS